MTAQHDAAASPVVGDRFEVEIGAVAHGGHCVARHNGQVIFVRHTLPGERVVVEVTSVGSGRRFLLADAVEVLTASPDRREPPCPYSGPGGCGGCDWQHVTPQAQRHMKSQVIAEAMLRQGGRDLEVDVEVVSGDQEGLGWRTRVTYSVNAEGNAGLLRHHSHDVVPIERCLLVTDAVDAVDVTRRRWPKTRSIAVVSTSMGESAVTVEPLPPAPVDRARLLDGIPESVAVVGVRGTGRLHESVAGTEYTVAAGSFWQVHPGAPELLTRAVIETLEPRPGDHVVDLYAGVGLFAVALADVVGVGGRVEAVESDPAACAAARRTSHARPNVLIHQDKADHWLAARSIRRCDLVVLDPPESGAGPKVLERIVRLSPRRIAYVSCGPASLGRDVRLMSKLGWTLTSLRAFDMFPTTHHVECLATFDPHHD
ncbi:MAG: class I SAM-dependent RNA methyltransferase [Actinomycetes bacterium]